MGEGSVNVFETLGRTAKQNDAPAEEMRAAEEESCTHLPQFSLLFLFRLYSKPRYPTTYLNHPGATPPPSMTTAKNAVEYKNQFVLMSARASIASSINESPRCASAIRTTPRNIHRFGYRSHTPCRIHTRVRALRELLASYHNSDASPTPASPGFLVWKMSAILFFGLFGFHPRVPLKQVPIGLTKPGGGASFGRISTWRLARMRVIAQGGTRFLDDNGKGATTGDHIR